MKRPSHATVVAYTALVLAMSGSAYAATGGAFILGHANVAGAASTLTNTGAGAALSLRAAKAATPALVVNTRAQVPNLNSTYLNGLTSTGIRPVVLVRQNSSSSLYGTASWTNVTGMSGTISIPAGRSRPTFFTYSAECIVTGGNNSDWGSVQILVDGIATTPNATNSQDFAFCSEGTNTAWIGASTQGYRLLTPGTHTVQVQALTTGAAAAQTRLDDMQLSVVAY
ncbi:MAG: hypothetical protein JO079_10260 [Frankiaceae bacterium]|nr:hypothetical protein [Frankiaceae bacterium]MBV9369139.1 hypothetical protein [Frankiales bacterium]